MSLTKIFIAPLWDTPRTLKFAVKSLIKQLFLSHQLYVLLMLAVARCMLFITSLVKNTQHSRKQYGSESFYDFRYFINES